MSVDIRQSDLRNDNADVMRRVAAGESFVVTVNGRPVADVGASSPEDHAAAIRAVSALPAALAASPVPDPAAWLAALTLADEILAPDEPVDSLLMSHTDCERATTRPTV